MSSNAKKSSVDWENIPKDIWTLIIQKLPMEDFLRCRSVSSSFLAIVTELKDCPEPRIPWLMFPKDLALDRWSFFDIASNKVHNIEFPELGRDSHILGTAEGWLIVVNWDAYNLKLFNPFTRALINLPPTASLPNLSPGCQGITFYFRRAFLARQGSTYVVVVAYGYTRHMDLAFARAGDGSWTALPTAKFSVDELTFAWCEGLIYMMDPNGGVIAHDLNGIGSSDIIPPPLEVVPHDEVLPVLNCHVRDKFMVVLPGSRDLLQIHRKGNFDEIRVFRLDKVLMEWVEVSNLGGNSLFLTPKGDGPHRAIAFHAKELKGDCMYISGDRFIKVFDMKIESSKCNFSTQFSWETRFGYIQEPEWISPVLVTLTPN